MQSRPLRATTRTIDLDHDQLLVIDDRPGTRLQVLFGGVWLTEESSLQDRFAGNGQWLALEARGRAIVESRGQTRLRLFDPAGVRDLPAWRTLGRWLGAGSRWLRTARQTLANWSSPTLGTSEGRPTTSGSTGPTAARSLRA